MKNNKVANSPGETLDGKEKLQARLSRIRRKVIVLSGKGGVGKSTVAVSLAVALARAGKRTGLLDADIHGPSVPVMLGLEGEKLRNSDEGLLPVERDGLKVVSLGFLLRKQDEAVIWRGPMKAALLEQFLRDVAWGDLDYLIVDSPPGTGDEPLSICQLLGNLDGAVIVTTPQRVAEADVRKSITFCRELQVPVLGVVENMGKFVCPKCGQAVEILPAGGGRRIAAGMEVPFLGSIPLDPAIAESCDRGRISTHHDISAGMEEIMGGIVKRLKAPGKPGTAGTNSKPEEEQTMKIAIPLAEGKLSLHFGHCQSFALLDVDAEGKKILKREDLEAPPHEPGLLPRWLAERGAGVIIAGGMGRRAQDLFRQQGIEVLVGAPAETPEKLAADYLAGTLRPGRNACDH